MSEHLEQAANLIDRRAFIESLFKSLLFRTPRTDEVDRWLALLNGGMAERDVVKRFLDSKEYGTKHEVIPGFPDGHYYSPVVDPSKVGDYWQASSSHKAADLIGLHFDLGLMLDLWQKSEAVVRMAPFTEEPGGGSRYYYNDGRYPDGDALVLLSMINTFRPARIIEIGSGFSSAAMLDTADMLGLENFQLICIDPYADRLRSLLRPHDHERVTIIEQQVQTVPVETFAALEENDILFIDSSHVLKTGSDVHYELFSILPVLKRGVLVHFHDIHFPFEYPAAWVFGKRWSWNEIYAVRAFLMYNSRFRIEFFTDYVFKSCPDVAANPMRGGKPMVGGSLWIRSIC